MAGKNGYDLMNFESEGEGPAVILLHGMSSSLREWYKLRPGLVEAGYRVIAADILGHGDSAKPAEARLYTSKAAYAVLSDWVDYLDLPEPFFLVGHSLGGYLSLNYALHHPQRLRKMVLLNPLYSLSQLSPAMNRLMPLNYVGVRILENTPGWVVRSFLAYTESFLTKVSQEDRRQYAADIMRASPHFLRIPADAEDMTPLLPQIQTETLVIYGLEDHLEAPASFPRLVDGLPKGSGVPVPGCGHHPHLGVPDLVKQLLLKFLT